MNGSGPQGHRKYASIDVHFVCVLVQGGRRMVFGACATRFINLYSTGQCGVYIVTGAQIKFVDRCQTRIIHHDHGEACAKSLVGRAMFAFVFCILAGSQQCWTKTKNTCARFCLAQLWSKCFFLRGSALRSRSESV